jgi:putative membrane protein
MNAHGSELHSECVAVRGSIHWNDMGRCVTPEPWYGPPLVRALVTQISHLLYRGFRTRWRQPRSRCDSNFQRVSRLEIGDTADWKSALPQLVSTPSRMDQDQRRPTIRRGVCWAVFAGTLLAFPITAHAHAREFHDEHWLSAWNWDPLISFNLLLLTGLYAAGLIRLWGKAGVGSGVSRGRAAAFFCGLFALFIALISPLDTLSAELSSAHMVQHMVLMNVAAPLLVVGSPALVLLWAFPLSARQSLGRWMHRLESWQSPHYPLWQPALLWLVYGFTLWIWHLPAFYEAALRNKWIHDFQHLSFVITACLFWRVLLDPVSRLRLSRGWAVIYLFTTSLHATVLGVFMALSPRVWYAEYEPLTLAWNLTAMEDQQLAGLIMWMPACMVYAVAAALLFGLWLRESPSAPQDNFQPSQGAQTS